MEQRTGDVAQQIYVSIKENGRNHKATSQFFSRLLKVPFNGMMSVELYKSWAGLTDLHLPPYVHLTSYPHFKPTLHVFDAR